MALIERFWNYFCDNFKTFCECFRRKKSFCALRAQFNSYSDEERAQLSQRRRRIGKVLGNRKKLAKQTFHSIRRESEKKTFLPSCCFLFSLRKTIYINKWNLFVSNERKKFWGCFRFFLLLPFLFLSLVCGSMVIHCGECTHVSTYHWWSHSGQVKYISIYIYTFMMTAEGKVFPPKTRSNSECYSIFRKMSLSIHSARPWPPRRFANDWKRGKSLQIWLKRDRNEGKKCFDCCLWSAAEVFS